MKASEFLTEFFEPRSRELVCVCSIANGSGGAQEFFTRDFSAVDPFVATWDKPGRGLYFGCATVTGKKRGKDNVAELICLYSDLDFKGIAASREEIEDVLAHLRLKPSLVVFSGHGLHAYWFFKTASTDRARVERLLKRLAWALAGDKTVAEIARVMRLPGSHNTKFDEWIDVDVVTRNAAEYSLDQLEVWLDAMPCPLLPRIEKVVEPKPDAAPTDGFAEVAEQHPSMQARLDIDAMWEGLEYYGIGAGGNLHATVVRIGAALLSRGEPVENTILYLREQLLARVGESASWDWRREIQDIQGQCVSWFVKHPELLTRQQNKPGWLTQDSRIRSMLGGAADARPRVKLDDSLRAQLAAGDTGTVVKLKPATSPDDETPRLTYVTGEKLEEMPVEEVQWIVPGFIMRNVVNGLFGDGGVGKDYLQLQLAIAMSCETKWLGRNVAPGKVLYFNVEDRLERLRWRQYCINTYNEVRAKDYPDRLRIVPMLGKNTIMATFDSRLGLVQPTSLYDAMCDMIEDYRPDLVIVGNRVNIFGVNQNDDSQARQCIELLNAITLDYETTIIMPGHVSVRGGADDSGASGSGSSGTVQWSNGLRNRLVLSKPKKEKEDDVVKPINPEEKNNHRLLEVVKVNDAPTGTKIEMHWHKGGLFVADDEPPEKAGHIPVDQQARELDFERELLKILDKNTMKNLNVSPDMDARNNAPKMCTTDPDCKYTGKDFRAEFRAAMDRLFAKGSIRSIEYGSPSRRYAKLERIKLHSVKKET